MDNKTQYINFWCWNNGFFCFDWWENLPCVQQAINRFKKVNGHEDHMFDGRHEAAILELKQANMLEF